MTKTVNVIKPKFDLERIITSTKTFKKRVSAYCRVSTDNTEQKTSYDAQVDEYTKRISQNPEWELVKVYADEGISGTSTKGRVQFNEMIEKAKRGDIDLIITKSISRFARNTVDCLSYIRELRAINCEIFFEKENIYSSDPKVDFLLTIMSSIAQEEARNISENVKWNVQKRFKDGIPVLNHKRFLGYTKEKRGGNLVIVPEEAQAIKLVFKMYIEGMGAKRIARKMTESGYKTGAGKSEWGETTVSCIIKNEKYCGDLLQQKTVIIDYLTHKQVKNSNLLPKYYIENNHEAIIDRETFELAQKIRKDRSDAQVGSNKNLAKYSYTYPFTSMIICNKCGRSLKRRYWNMNTSAQRIMQQCGNYIEGKGKCDGKAVYNDVLEGATIKMLNEVFISKIKVMDTIKEAIKRNITVSDTERKLNITKKQKAEKETMLGNLIDIQMKNPSMNDVVFTNKYNELKYEIEDYRRTLDILEAEYVDIYDTESRLNRINDFLKIHENQVTELTVELLKAFVHRILAVERDNVIFFVAGSKKYNDSEFIENREKFMDYPVIHEGKYYHEKLKRSMNYRVIII